MGIRNFFQKEIWKDLHKLSFTRQVLYKYLRILISTGEGFFKNKGFEKASTLTFYSLLSIIPMVAIGFGIAQLFGFEDKFADQIKIQLQSQPQVADKIIQFAHSTLKQTRGGIIAGFGIAVLLWTVLCMIGNIETYFNEFWQVKTPRTLWQQVKCYIPLIFLFPLFLVGSSSLIIYISTIAILTSQSINVLNFLNSYIVDLFKIIPHLLSWLLLSFLYIFLPNTKVPWKAGIIAGISTGILFNIWQWIYVTFQVNASSYGAIYGSFAAIPLFLIWLNYSWLLVLFGSELSFQIHNELKAKK